MAKHLKEPTPAYTYQPDNIDELNAAARVESIPVVDESGAPADIDVGFEIPQLVPDDEPAVEPTYESTTPGVLGFGAASSARTAEARPLPTRSTGERSARARDLAEWAAEMEAREVHRNAQAALGARALQQQSLDSLHDAASAQPVQPSGFYDMK